jgi:hypothetical protein
VQWQKLQKAEQDNEVPCRPLGAYMYVSYAPVARTEELVAGVVYADFDEHGKLVGVEVLMPSDADDCG